MNDVRGSKRDPTEQLDAEQVLEQRVQERTRELAALLEVSRSLSSTLALEPLLDVVLEQLKTVADYRGATISVLEDDRIRELRRRTREGEVPPAREVPLLHVAGWWSVIARGEPVIVRDVQSDEPLAQAYRTTAQHALNARPVYSIHAWMAVPLTLNDRVIGCISLSHEQPGFYTERHAELATAIATQAAVAIENAGLYAQTEQRTRELATLLEVSRSLSSTLELEPLLGLILDELNLVVEYTSATAITREDGRYLMREYRGPESRDLVLSRSLPAAAVDDLFGLFGRDKTFIIPDVWADTPAGRAWRATGSEEYLRKAVNRVGCVLNAPMVHKGQLVGSLILSHRTPGYFTEHHAALTQAVADQATVAIENARLYEGERAAQEAAARQLERMSLLAEITRQLLTTMELESVLGVLARSAWRLCGARQAAIALRDAQDDGFTIRTVDAGPDARGAGGMAGTRLDAAGLAGTPLERAFREQTAVVIEDVRTLPASPARDMGLAAGLLSGVAAPLVVEGRAIGLLIVNDTRVRPFPPEDVALLQALADQAALAIEHARLYDEQRRTAQELASLLEVSHNLASTLELEPLLDVILDQIKVVAGSDTALISTYDGDSVRIIRRHAPTPIDPDNEQVRGVNPMSAGPIWAQLQRGEPVIIGDVRGDEPLAQAYRAVHSVPVDTAHLRDVRSWMAVPLMVNDGVIGFIGIMSGEPDAYGAHNAQLVAAIATQAAAAIENARLHAQTEERARELATLLEVSRAVASMLDLTPLLDLILEQLKVVLDYRGATLGTIAGEDLLIVASHATTPERASDRGLRFPLSRFGRIWQAISGGEPVIIADVQGDTPEAVEYRELNARLMDGPTHRDIRSWMAVPLALGERVIGMLTVSQDVPSYFTAHHAELALAFANQVTIAVENARLFAEAEGKAALEERQRLARELHDSVSQALFGIALGARTARRRLDQDPARLVESLDYVLSLAEVGLIEMRALIFELRPEALEKDGLVIALTRHAAATSARHEIAVETTLGEEPDVPLATKEAFYRIAQEAMHNAVKHARATRIDLVLAHGHDGLTLDVQDDGIGFDPSQNFAGHLGLHSMRERMAAVGGTTDITSAPGVGTRVHVAAPFA